MLLLERRARTMPRLAPTFTVAFVAATGVLGCPSAPPSTPPTPTDEAPAEPPQPVPPAPEEASAWTETAVDLPHPGCFVLHRLGSSTMKAGGAQSCDEQTSPASTFKVPHALIALDTGVVTDPEAQAKWDGTKYPHMPNWQRDHNLRTAIYESVVWFFQGTARKIGRERMQEYLRAFEYGNATVEGPIDMFWLREESLRVSPPQTLRFWAALYTDTLPRGGDVAPVLRPLLVRPPKSFAGRVPDGFEIPAMHPDAVFSAKTGTGYYTADGNKGSVTWLAGHVACPDAQYVFVSRVTAPDEPSANSPATAHGLAALDRLGVLGCTATD